VEYYCLRDDFYHNGFFERKIVLVPDNLCQLTNYNPLEVGTL
jgi:hypothetical protein